MLVLVARTFNGCSFWWLLTENLQTQQERVGIRVFISYAVFSPPGALVCTNVCAGASVGPRSTPQISHQKESLFLIYNQITYLEVKPSIVYFFFLFKYE